MKCSDPLTVGANRAPKKLLPRVCVLRGEKRAGRSEDPCHSISKVSDCLNQALPPISNCHEHLGQKGCMPECDR